MIYNQVLALLHMCWCVFLVSSAACRLKKKTFFFVVCEEVSTASWRPRDTVLFQVNLTLIVCYSILDACGRPLKRSKQQKKLYNISFN